MPKTATLGKSAKPEKPRPDFPLTANGNGQWSKKVRGRVHYFGKWADPDGALNLWLDQKEDLLAGRKPRSVMGGLSVRDLCNRFLTAKKHLLDAGEITGRTFQDYHAVCERVVEAFGKERTVDDLAADDFETLRAKLAKTRGPVALGNEVQRCRVVFKYAFDAGLIDKPVRYGPTFKRPSKEILRQARHKRGPRMFEAQQLQKMIKAAGPQLRAMILIGINAGFGNSDVANLPLKAVDLDGGWVNFPRPKTGIPRRCPLWPDTIKSLRAAIKARSAPKNEDDADLVFVTKYGQKWSKESSSANPVSAECRKLLRKIGVTQSGLNFYALRHTFETIGGESRDQVAVDAIMGHSPDTNDMASVYRERVSDERLRAVTEHVRKWLFAKPKQPAAKRPAPSSTLSAKLARCSVSQKPMRWSGPWSADLVDGK